MLYAITPTELCLDDTALLTAVQTLLDHGLQQLQYRDKSQDAPRRLRQVQILHQRCRAAGARLIVNDDVALAAWADGVHLGQGDGSVAAARAQLGPAAIIGVTCHDRLDLAEAAHAEGANYLAFGALFPSRTKPHARPAPLSLLSEARRFGLPVCAIGGIGPDNAHAVYTAGADWIAAVGAAFESLALLRVCQALSA